MYVLLPSSASMSFWSIIGIYLMAQTLGMISQVPGGIGVFEATALYLYSPHIPAPVVAGALLAYRIIYYLFPFFIAASMLVVYEIGMRRHGIHKAVTVLGKFGSSLVPHILSVATFLSGVVLLFSGATPGVERRLLWLKSFLPLPVLEVSHFLGSLAGLGLLLLARGIQLRLDAAYLFTCILLAAGAFFSLLKGFDYEEAAVLALMFGVLLPCRSYFYRKASLFSQRFTAEWIAAIVIVLIGSVWLGIFAYKHTEFLNEQWWRFSIYGDASRSLRATVGVISVALFLALAKLFRPSAAEPKLPGEDDLVKLLPVIAGSKKTYANLALLRDKRLLISPSGKSFIMYAIEGRSWIAMGDPVGDPDECRELIWQFREMCDLQKGWTVFYEVGLEGLPVYLDLGLSVSKIGEEAKIDLAAYSLEGGIHKKYRHTIHVIEKDGCAFEIVPRDRIPAFLQDFRRISDAWLAEKNTREKRFSLGSFSEDYIKYFPAGIVKKDGRVLAFVNIWEGAEKEELSIDLIRYLQEAPYGLTDYLIINLMLWGRKEGYRWFNLGMAPLSGIEARSLSPLWNRMGAFVYRHGEHFYNFQGLRQYKEKFGPVWAPKYLAVSNGLALPRILTNLASLISGGLKGVIAK
jgi:phosphatidylglycerol lysyltransferase